MWIDATIAALHHRPEAEQQGEQGGLRAEPPAPHQKAPTGCGLALAIPAGTKNAADAQKFITWATSKDYIRLVAKTKGWGHVPTGTRKSTYANPEFLRRRYSPRPRRSLASANPNDSTLPKSLRPQFAAIPEFPGDRYRGGPADQRGAVGQDQQWRRRIRRLNRSPTARCSGRVLKVARETTSDRF